MSFFRKSGGQGYRDNTRDTHAADRGEGKHRAADPTRATSRTEGDGRHAKQGGAHRKDK